MTDRVRPIAGVPKIDHASQVADGLEAVARDVRAGRMPVTVRRCLVIVSGPDADGDGVGAVYLGAKASMMETMGMLELAKIQLADAE